MSMRRFVGMMTLVLLAGVSVLGCGERIDIPQPVGEFSTSGYQARDSYPVENVQDLCTAAGQIFVLSSASLTKRNQSFTELNLVEGFTAATALCLGEGDTTIFVWDNGTKEVSWYSTRDLSVPLGQPGSTSLPEVQACVGMATSPAGVEQVPGALTYLYMSDPISEVVHRYAFDPYVGLLPHGILCRGGGEGARFANVPAGLARDSADSVLVCDMDIERNWVIRFNSVPDTTDTATEGLDPLRGTAALFRELPCTPQPAQAYVLGDAAGCGETGWEGGFSSETGAFTYPNDVAVDGSGRIFVADLGNNRVQIFEADGVYDQAIGDDTIMPSPSAVAVSDYEVNFDEVFYGALLWVIGEGEVRKFFSADYYDWWNQQNYED